MSSPVVAIIAPGAMGAGVARRLTDSGLRILSPCASRSEITRKRAMDAGMVDASLSQILREADWLLSILPPKEAEASAKEVLEEARALDLPRYPVYVDCNAKNIDTTIRLASFFTGGPIIFLNACIIGLPPQGTHDPVFYASASPDAKDQEALANFGTLNRYGLRVKTIAGDGTDLCDASALKMTFSVSKKLPAHNRGLAVIMTVLPTRAS